MSKWYKPRKPLSEYPETGQQKKIRVAGRIVADLCKGKKSVEFHACRHEVLACMFQNQKCDIEVLDKKKELEEKEKTT